MSKQDMIEIDGIVVDTLPNAAFKVKLENGHEILAHVSGKIRMHHIRIYQGSCHSGDFSIRLNTWAYYF